MPSKKKTSRKSRPRSRSISWKSRSPYKYNRRNNLLKQVSKKKSKSRSKSKSKKKRSKSKSKKKRSKSRKRYASSVPKSKKNKSKSPRKLVDISAFQYKRKSPRFSSSDGFQRVQNGRRKNVTVGGGYNRKIHTLSRKMYHMTNGSYHRTSQSPKRHN